MFNYIANCHATLHKMSVSLKKVILDYFYKMLRIFGLINDDKKVESDESTHLLSIINKLRNEIRTLAKNKSDYTHLYGVCDRLRDELKQLGYVIDDKGTESVIRKL
ncbi:hypothetical protein BDAP_000731 [Binucleata daphniae]